ncbi:MAG: hypothetical protein ABIO40_07760 [Devosia sp.]
MRLNSKLSWGLAWAGLALVIAVPSADFFTGATPSAAVVTSDTDPVQTASVTPIVDTPVITAAPRKIELAPASPGLTPIPTVVAEPAMKPEATPAKAKVASVAPAPKTAPFPAPLSQRPHPPATEAEEQPAASDEDSAVEDDSIFLPEDVATAEPHGPVPPKGIEDDDFFSDPESLRQFLIVKGLFDDGENSGIDVNAAAAEEVDAGFDEDGFYLSDGPNNDGDDFSDEDEDGSFLFF